jgi:hypothetical protein
MINKTKWVGCAMLPAVLACGCAGMSNADRGTVGGGLLGAGVGAAIGSAAKAPGAGALIGAGAGALIGGAAGEAKDRKEAQAVAAQRATVLRMEDIVYMTQSHVSDGVIINQIRTTGALYNLSANDIAYLKSQGVSDAVVAEMQATAARPVRQVYTAQPVYVVEPPPPPVSVGVGVGFGRRW